MNPTKIHEQEGALREKNAVEAGALYLVGTPIGNLADLSERAKKVLSEVDFIAAEDTRNSGRMLAYFGIKKPMVSYYEHNKHIRGPEITARLRDGESCALITDAGMPAISDPGEELVRLCASETLPVFVVPGPCAAVSALSLSGLPTSRFVFEGFLPVATAERKKALSSLLNEMRTIIFYEAPHKLRTTLDDLLCAFGDRRLSLCRELTKLNEEVIRTTISGAVTLYTQIEPRGEYVLVMEGLPAEKQKESAFWSAMSEEEHFAYYLAQGLPKNDALKAVARDRGVGKSEIYQHLMVK